MHAEETLSTLSYASRAKNIHNAPTVHMDPREAALAAMRREVRLLRTENAFLREQLVLASGDRTLASLDGPSLLETPASQSPPPMTGLPPGSAASSPSAAAALPAQSVLVPVPTAAVQDGVPAGPQQDAARRLADAQRLLGVLANENARLAVENDRLRAGGLQVAGDYSGAVEEVEWLQAKLARLEASLLGAGDAGTSRDALVEESERFCNDSREGLEERKEGDEEAILNSKSGDAVQLAESIPSPAHYANGPPALALQDDGSLPPLTSVAGSELHSNGVQGAGLRETLEEPLPSVVVAAEEGDESCHAEGTDGLDQEGNSRNAHSVVAKDKLPGSPHARAAEGEEGRQVLRDIEMA